MLRSTRAGKGKEKSGVGWICWTEKTDGFRIVRINVLEGKAGLI